MQISTTSSNKRVKTNTKQRKLWADLIRVIAIYLVIQIHSYYGTQDSLSVNTVLNKFDVMGVPFFIMLSGTLLLGKNESYIVFFKKRCLKVLIPWIIWTFLYMLYYDNVHHAQILHDFFPNRTNGLYDFSRFFFRTFMSNLWFLPMIFSIYLLTPMLRNFVARASTLDYTYALALWFLFCSLLPYLFNNVEFPVWEPNVLLVPIQFSGYFLLGYMIVKRNVLQKIPWFALLALCIVLFLCSLLLFKNLQLQSILSNALYPGVVVVSICIFSLLYRLSNHIENDVNPLLKRVIYIVSSASFGIYLVNEMFLDYSKMTLIHYLHIYHIELFMSPLVFICATLFILLLQKIPIIKYIVP